MWGSRYFTARYWDARYWAATGGVTVALLAGVVLKISDICEPLLVSTLPPQLRITNAFPPLKIHSRSI